MSWNITHDPLYHVELDCQFTERMKGLRFRREQLEILTRSTDIESGFAKQAPIWLSEGKSLDVVEAFLQGLAEAGRNLDHHACFSTWAELVHADPMRFFENLNFANYPLDLAKTPNPLFSKDDSFATLNALLALDPVRCLQIPGLLSGAWKAGAMNPETRDLALIGIFSAFTRYTRYQEKHRHRDNYEIPLETHAKNVFSQLGKVIDLNFSGFLEQLPDSPQEMTPVLHRYYGKLAGEMKNAEHLLPPLPIPRQMDSNGHPYALLCLGLKAKLVSTPGHIKYLDRVRSKNEKRRFSPNWEQDVFSRVIQNDYSDLKQIRAAVRSYSLEAHHIEMLEERGLVKQYLKGLPAEEREFLIAKDVVPVRLIVKVKELGNKFGQDLGL
ncbi:hypothetical protein [Pseudomonas serbica]|uniref:hypothetical protein n=1 Tax=Pseudomonas serbica TaxID=2965074 RepID=UPI00237AA354|nr:hypothetical protein [Pseudomonas serbica]